MHLRDYVDPALIFMGLEPIHKDALLDELARRTAERLNDVDSDTLLAKLREREADSSTGVGQGVAIPHCFLQGVEASRCILAQVPAGLGYEAIDDHPVYVVFMLISPPDARMAHLRLLARISRVAHRKGFARDVAACDTAEALHRLIVKEDLSHTG